MSNVVRLRKQTKQTPPRKPCVANGCRRTLSARSKFTECGPCRYHEKRWSAPGITLADIEELHDRNTLGVYRFSKHLGRKVTYTARRRA